MNVRMLLLAARGHSRPRHATRFMMLRSVTDAYGVFPLRPDPNPNDGRESDASRGIAGTTT